MIVVDENDPVGGAYTLEVYYYNYIKSQINIYIYT